MSPSGQRSAHRRARSRRQSKTLSRQTVLGQQGINLIERIVLEMQCIWNPTVAIDVGIDGTIELCDPATGTALNTILQVQSKATDGTWEHETPDGFDYVCRPQDLDHWLQGNAPVLLIASRPRTDEAYWLSVKDHFRDPVRRQTRRAHFEKARDRFASDCLRILLSVATPKDVGLYLSPSPRTETLVSNLLEVQSFAPRIYIAETGSRRRAEIYAVFQALDRPCPSEWFLKEKRIVSFHDLTEHPWERVCDRSTVEDIATEDWAFCADADLRRDFVRLLNGALREKLYPEVRLWSGLNVFAFTAPKDLKRRVIQYIGVNRTNRRAVFEPYSREFNGQEFVHFRHLAFEWRFRLHDQRW